VTLLDYLCTTSISEWATYVIPVGSKGTQHLMLVKSSFGSEFIATLCKFQFLYAKCPHHQTNYLWCNSLSTDVNGNHPFYIGHRCSCQWLKVWMLWTRCVHWSNLISDVVLIGMRLFCLCFIASIYSLQWIQYGIIFHSLTITTASSNHYLLLEYADGEQHLQPDLWDFR
jgi:hypothetical protein